VHQQTFTPHDLDRALEYYEAALDIQPDYAAVYAGIALIWGSKLVLGMASARGPVGRRVVPSSRMAKLIYITNATLDGYIEDQSGAFDWGNPDQIFDFITELMRPIGTHLLGRRLYQAMAHWDAPVESYPPEQRDFARVWQKAEQIVFSRTLTDAPTRIGRVEREFDPEATRKLKRESEHDIFIGGAELAGLALESNLIDECHLFLHPVIVGGGKPAFRAALRRDLELLETRHFGTGVIHLRYRVRGATP
jgi:dihydrofolate reductase